jgi:protein-tyrosine kinase
MSSIERAMDKLAGAEPTVAPAAGPEPTTPVPVDARAEDHATSPPAAATPVVPPVTSTPEPTPTPMGTSTDTIPAPAATVAIKDEAATVAHTTAARMSGEIAIIDFDRLAAAGFLVPGQTMTREAEEFQRIKRRLLGNMVPGVYASERPPNLVLVTSSVPGEGKTFVSVNLALSIAMEIDRTVLAIDTDIVKRDMSKVFGVVHRRGLFDMLADASLKMPDLLVRTSVPNLTILPAGNRHTSSTEMLASQRMRELTDELAARYRDRVILFDSPPVLAMTTATALAPLMGQIVVVCEAGSTKHETIRETLHRLEDVRVTGVVLNKSKQAYASGYDYYGSYGQKR